MSLFILGTGTLNSDPQRRTSASGKEFVTASIRAATEDEPVSISAIVFDAVACAALTNLRKERLLPDQRSRQAHELDNQRRRAAGWFERVAAS